MIQIKIADVFLAALCDRGTRSCRMGRVEHVLSAQVLKISTCLRFANGRLGQVELDPETRPRRTVPRASL
jgi:hypothetical protein